MNGSLLHALFRQGSFYRLATQESLWADHGIGALCAFFEALRREELHREWASDVPREPQKWGYSPELDADIHKFLMAQMLPKVVVDKATVKEKDISSVHAESIPNVVAASSRGVPLLLFDLERPGSQPPEPGWQASYFTGCGEQDNVLESDNFRVNVRLGDKRDAGRLGVFLIVREELLHELAMLAARNAEDYPDAEATSLTAWDEELPALPRHGYAPEDAAKIMRQVLNEIDEGNASDTTESDLPRIRKAWWLATTLARAVGLESVTSVRPNDGPDEPRFYVDVKLGHVSPTVAAQSQACWGILCLGPKK